MSNAKNLLIAQMERALELLGTESIENPLIDNSWNTINRNHTELRIKLHEIRRDSIRFIKECNGE